MCGSSFRHDKKVLFKLCFERGKRKLVRNVWLEAANSEKESPC